MKRFNALLASTCLMLLVIGYAGHGFCQGSLTPPGPPGSTMHSLQEIYNLNRTIDSNTYQTLMIVSAFDFGPIVEFGNYFSNLTSFLVFGMYPYVTSTYVCATSTYVCVTNMSDRMWQVQVAISNLSEEVLVMTNIIDYFVYMASNVNVVNTKVDNVMSNMAVMDAKLDVINAKLDLLGP